MTDQQQIYIFNNNLKKLMAERGYTQKEVADAIGVSPQAMNFWMAGRNLPRMDKIQKLADFLGVSKLDLIEERPKFTLVQQGIIAEIVNECRKLTPDQQQLILNLCRQLNEEKGK